MLGRAVLDHLEQSNSYSLIATLRTTGQIPPERAHLSFACFDISQTDVEPLCQKYGQVDAVVHIAASISNDNQKTSLIFDNCLGVLNCINLAKSLKAKRFIYISSVQVIGDPLFLPITEEHPLKPKSLYHISKLFGEQLLLMQENSSLNPAILRIPSPIGPGMKPNGIVATFMDKASRGEDIVLHGKGEREQNYIDVRDIARAVACALRTTSHGIYNIAAVKSISNLKLAKLCKKVCCSNSRIVFSGAKDPEEAARWQIATGKAASELGFEPAYDLAESLRHAFLPCAVQDQIML